jgi:hypothetical protein
MSNWNYNRWNSTPISNIFQFDKISYEEFIKSYSALESSIEGDIVKYMKNMLGKQDYTFTSEVRSYVWESKDIPELWRIFVSNKRGLSFEVKYGADINTANLAWTDFISLLDKNK